MVFLLSTVILLTMAIAGHFLPGWTRPELYFAARVDPGFRQTEAARQILIRYRLILWLSVALAAGLQFVFRLEWAVVIPIIGFLLALVDAHRRALAHAVPVSAVVEVNLAAPPEKFPGGPIVMFLPIVLLSVLALWADRHFDDLPQRIPVHWSLHGANRWIERTHAGVAIYLAGCAGVSLLFALMGWGIFHWSRRVSTSGPRAAVERRFRRRNAQMFLFVSWFAAIQAWFTLTQPSRAVWAPIAATAAIAIFAIMLIRYHQAAGDRAPDSCWKLGIIYFNPADPSMFIPKRFGVGYTFNFGNRWSWVVFALVLVPAIFASAYLR